MRIQAKPLNDINKEAIDLSLNNYLLYFIYLYKSSYEKYLKINNL